MTTQTSQSPAPASGVQGSHHWILTLELPGRAAATQYGTWNPHPGATRSDVFLAIRQEISRRHPELSSAVVSFFSLEPNQL
ncbi:hypothetical protein OG592_30660 [Streptomyces avidinii]|uniref:hypothetical protein n=1 Tax=Streptomyces avidinii TaxID=1895 RepID=UPI003863E84D|nr:hypothetical protein OG592_30660 [Streptomyces avidinii]